MMPAVRALDDLHRRFGATGSYFVDACFIDRPPQRAKAVCEMLIARESPYRFGCDLQWPDLENHELLGLTNAPSGVPLSVPRARSRLPRNPSTPRQGAHHGETGRGSLQHAIDLGFLIRASIGIGWPGATETDIEDTLGLIDGVPDLLFDGYRYLPLPGVPLTAQWARGAGPGGLNRTRELAFQDYSVHNGNFSAIPDERYEQLWAELLRRQDERLGRAFTK